MKRQRSLLDTFTLVKKPTFVSDDNYRVQHQAQNDVTSFPIGPTGRCKLR